MGMRKLIAAVAVAMIASGALPARAEETCGGHEEGFLHLRISPAQEVYGFGETLKVNAEVVRRLPTGDVPVEGAEVYVSLSKRRLVSFGRAVTDTDGQAVVRMRSFNPAVGLLDASGLAELKYTDINHCLDRSNRDTVTREDFIRIVK